MSILLSYRCFRFFFFLIAAESNTFISEGRQQKDNNERTSPTFCNERGLAYKAALLWFP